MSLQENSGAAMTVKIKVKALSGKKLFLIHNDVKLSFFKSSGKVRENNSPKDL